MKNVAVIGAAGFWGACYMRGFASHPRCRIVAVADTSARRLARVADHYGVERRFSTAEELLRSGVPDIVAVVVPVMHAYGVVLACAEAGVRVIACEKPISETLQKADHMVEVCRKRGISLSCGTALWEVPRLEEAARWIQAGNLGDLREASIPSGVGQQASGTGCVLFNFLRFLTGREAQWVEGWTSPPQAAFGDEDCNAYGRIGFSGGMVCEVPSPADALVRSECVSVRTSAGHLWAAREGIQIIRGEGPKAGPVFTDFVRPEPEEWDSFSHLTDSLVALHDHGGEAPCSGHDYRQALEIAIALKLSARQGHARVSLPLGDRAQVLLPHPYRMKGGDVAGWDSIGLPLPSILPDLPRTRTGSARVSRRVEAVPRSGIREILDLATEPETIHLEIGQPDFPTPSHIVEAAHQAAREGFTGYTANGGIPALREAIAEKVRRDNGIEAGPDQVIVTVGAMQGLLICMLAALDPGDEVLVPDPGYPNYTMAASLCAARAVPYPLDPALGYQPVIDAMAESVGPRTRAVVINSPSNPTGCVIDEQRMRRILSIAEARGLFVISDECYEKVLFSGRHASPAALGVCGRVLTVNSFSKTYSMTGWRVGYVVAPSSLSAQLVKLQEATVACAPSVSQKAALAAILGPQDCVGSMVEEYRKRRDLALSILEPAGLCSYRPQGAFYLLADVAGRVADPAAFPRKLLSERGVAVAPGRTFGERSSACVRISFCASHEALRDGLNRLVGFAAPSGVSAGKPDR